MFPDYERFAILWMNEAALAAALDLRGSFNQLVVQLAPGAREHRWAHLLCGAVC